MRSGRLMYLETIAFLLFGAFLQGANAIRWLALSRIGSVAMGGGPEFPSTGFSILSMCEGFHGSLINKQVQFCKKHPGFMDSVIVGAIHAIDECQFQFKTRRWNCSTLEETSAWHKPFRRKQTGEEVPADSSDIKSTAVKAEIPGLEVMERNTRAILGGRRENGTKLGNKKHSSKKFQQAPMGPYPIVPAGTREAAFVHAISAAGVAHAVTRACSTGMLDDCSCDRSIRGVSPAGFQWSGCSDHIDFGTSFSRSFVDAREHRLSRKQSSPLALLNLHNNEAGRKVIERNMKIECKCHGVSGSCELKTCWKAMPSFRQVGELLKDKFDGATEVEQQKIGSRRQLIPRNAQFKAHSDSDLVYLKRSPDFCEHDNSIGSLGTHDRECNKTSKGIDGCDLLCCNRGYRAHKERRVERCMCKFHWCCFVECKECVREVEVFTCQ